MNADFAFRAAAIALAVVLAVAPYHRQITEAAYRLLEAAKEKANLLTRLAAIGLLIAAAWGKVPMPTLSRPAATVTVETPSDELQRLVTPVAEAMAGTGPAERALWAETWTKAGVVVAGDAVSQTVAFTDTKILRDYTALALDIAWRRIAGHVPGSNEPLRKAVEAAYGAVVGTDVVPVSADLRARYVALAKALAWAGTR